MLKLESTRNKKWLIKTLDETKERDLILGTSSWCYQTLIVENHAWRDRFWNKVK